MWTRLHLVFGACLLLAPSQRNRAWGKKRGRCPHQKYALDYCEIGRSTCTTDEDCAGSKKCCDQSCIHKCIAALTGPYLAISPTKHNVEQGESVTVTCRLQEQPFEGWYDPGRRKILSRSAADPVHVRRTDTPGEYQLFITNASVTHAGRYSCRGALTKGGFTLNVGCTIANTTSPQYMAPGTTGIIQVTVKGHPVPQYTWSRAGRPLDTTADRYAVSPSGSLSIRDVTSSDVGEYMLSVRQQLATGYIKLIENQRVEVLTQSARCPDDKRKKSRVNCQIGLANQCSTDAECDGKPCCYDGCRYKCKGRREIGEVTKGFCPFIKAPKACASDSDRCQHDWDCPKAMKCCSDSCRNLCVKPSPFGAGIMRPGVQLLQYDEYFTAGQVVRRVCRVHGQPFEGWYDQYGRKVTSQPGHVFTERRGPYHVLVINGVTAKDGGKYTCRGAFDSGVISVNVNSSVVKTPPRLMQLPPEGDVLLIEAVVTGYPTPRFMWYKDGVAIPRRSRRYAVSPSGSLVIAAVHPSDVGTYLMKVRQAGQLHNTGITVRVSNRTTAVPHLPARLKGAAVTCHKKEMVIAIDKTLLDGTQVQTLQLRDPKCHATTNGSHFIIRAPLVGCGTTSRHRDDVIVYSNAVGDRLPVGMVTRMYDINIPFSCFYSAVGITSTLGVLPIKVPKLVQGSNSTTKFDLSMTLYKDGSFTGPFVKDDYPLRLKLNQPLYIEVKVDSPDTQLAVLAERCYATPTQNPGHPVAYDIITNGCKTDPTLQLYQSPVATQRFSFRVFQFVQASGKFLFIHCRVVVCNATDPGSRCARACTDDKISGRLRRETREEKADFTQGPIIVLEQSRMPAQRNAQQEADAIPVQFLWLIIAMVVFCAACLMAMVYMMRKHAMTLSTQAATADDALETRL